MAEIGHNVVGYFLFVNEPEAVDGTTAYTHNPAIDGSTTYGTTWYCFPRRCTVGSAFNSNTFGKAGTCYPGSRCFDVRLATSFVTATISSRDC